MKKIIVIITLVVLTITLYFLASFYGTPWGKAQAEKRFAEYIKQNYGDTVVYSVYYFFKTGYYAECTSKIITQNRFLLLFDEHNNIKVIETY